MTLQFVQAHAAGQDGVLNEEWFVLENTGPNAFVSQGCTVTVSKNSHARGREVGKIDPGFVLHAGEKIRLVTGSPGKKAHGAPPEEQKELKNYHLFLGGPMLSGSGTVIRLVLNQVEMAKATFDPSAKNGLAKEA